MSVSELKAFKNSALISRKEPADDNRRECGESLTERLVCAICSFLWHHTGNAVHICPVSNTLHMNTVLTIAYWRIPAQIYTSLNQTGIQSPFWFCAPKKSFPVKTSHPVQESISQLDFIPNYGGCQLTY